MFTMNEKEASGFAEVAMAYIYAYCTAYNIRKELKRKENHGIPKMVQHEKLPKHLTEWRTRD